MRVSTSRAGRQFSRELHSLSTTNDDFPLGYLEQSGKVDDSDRVIEVLTATTATSVYSQCMTGTTETHFLKSQRT